MSTARVGRAGEGHCGGPAPVLVLNSGWPGGFSEGCVARQGVGHWTRAKPAPAGPPSAVSTLSVPGAAGSSPHQACSGSATCSTARPHLGLSSCFSTKALTLQPAAACALDLCLPSRPGAFSRLAWSPPHRPALPGRQSPVLSWPVWVTCLPPSSTLSSKATGRSCLADRLLQLLSPCMAHSRCLINSCRYGSGVCPF